MKEYVFLNGKYIEADKFLKVSELIIMMKKNSFIFLE